MATTMRVVDGDMTVGVVPDLDHDGDDDEKKEDELVATSNTSSGSSQEALVMTPCKHLHGKDNINNFVVTPDTPYDNLYNPTYAGYGRRDETSVEPNKEALDIVFGPLKKELEDHDVETEAAVDATLQEKKIQAINSLPGCNDGVEPLPSPPRRTSRVFMTASALDRTLTPRLPSSSSSSSASIVVGTGLSELSKQLRVLQAKNQYLQSEMERCQRQLKIMSESKGVSVVDVLASLEAACASVAHAELRSQINSLEAQLEAQKHAKTPPRSGSTSGMDKANQLQLDSLKQQIASLQLQLGEQEELEAKYKEETKSLYVQVQTHQTKATTWEATSAQQTLLLETERGRNAALESEVVALRQERDVLKEQQTKRMAEIWQQTLHKSWSMDENDNDYLMDSDMGLYRNTDNNTTSKETVARKIVHDTHDKKPTDFALAPDRPRLCRTYSDPALWGQHQDSISGMPKGFVASMRPRYSNSFKQWSYDADNSHRSKLYVKQSAKNMELEVLCRQQQQTLQQLQQEQCRDQAKWERLELERDAAQARRNIIEQQVHTLQLDLRLEKEQAENLREQLRRREEEYSLKKDQLTSRLQVHQERTADLEGQLSSLYVAFELLQEDRSEEQTEQAELKSRLIDADSAIAQQISEKAHGTEDAKLAREISLQGLPMESDVSESGVASLPSPSGAVAQSPKQTSRTSFFSRGNSSSSLKGLPKAPPFASGHRKESTSSAGLPPTVPKQSKQRRSSTGSFFSEAPPPPGTTICKGYLLQQQPRKKKLLGGGGRPPLWKKKYVVLKRGDGQTWAGSYCLWYGDIPSGKVLGTVPHLIRGVSTVSFCGSEVSDPSSMPHSFLLRINPSDPDAPVVQFAAFSAAELEPWKVVLQESLNVDDHSLNLQELQRAQRLVAVAVAKNYGS